MTYESKEGSGALFPNDKGTNTSRPDWRGDLMVGGVLYEVAGWAKEGRRGAFISLSAKPKEERTAEAPRQPQRSASPSASPRQRDEAYQAAGARPTGRMNDWRPRENDEDDIPFN